MTDLFAEARIKHLARQFRLALSDDYEAKAVVRSGTVITGSSVNVSGQRYDFVNTTNPSFPAGAVLDVVNVQRSAAAIYAPADTGGIVIMGGAGGMGGGEGGGPSIEVSEGPGIDVVASGLSRQIGLGGDMILLYDSAGAPVAEYDTIAAATAAATSGDLIQLPAGTWTEAVVLGAGVTLKGLGQRISILSGQVTGGDGSTLECLSVIRTANDASKLIAYLGPASGTGYITDCILRATQSGAGTGYAISVQAGDVEFANGGWSATTSMTDEV